MKKLIALAMTSLIVAGCGHGGNGSGSRVYTHNELAQIFVNELNSTGQYYVTLAKDSTLQYDYIVIYDLDFGTYTAVNIGGYRPGQNPIYYVESAYSYYNLYVIPEHYDVIEGWVPTRYRDPYTGITFEKIRGTPKDTALVAALAEAKVINQRAEKVSTQFGLSMERSKDMVRLSMAWRKAGGKDLSARDQDAFAKEMLGFSITQAMSAAKENAAGNKKPLEELVEKAAETNGITPEHVREIMGIYFQK